MPSLGRPVSSRVLSSRVLSRGSGRGIWRVCARVSAVGVCHGARTRTACRVPRAHTARYAFRMHACEGVWGRAAAAGAGDAGRGALRGRGGPRAPPRRRQRPHGQHAPRPGTGPSGPRWYHPHSRVTAPPPRQRARQGRAGGGAGAGGCVPCCFAGGCTSGGGGGGGCGVRACCVAARAHVAAHAHACHAQGGAAAGCVCVSVCCLAGWCAG